MEAPRQHSWPGLFNGVVRPLQRRRQSNNASRGYSPFPPSIVDQFTLRHEMKNKGGGGVGGEMVGVQLLTFCYLAALNCWLLLCPATLSHDWQMGSVPLVASLADTRNLATCLFFGGCLILTYKAFTDFEVSATNDE
ncbi:hypothetical protein K0M31_003015 [Melipona bicolor]|uniref:DUF1736 domain-containing protein n=1 Tax=Melipona bicolor TaxID=60889 RepID=A0AA40G090_9HYME|nr:hypothetical protein K0M31_003015 [Melipona bicolor]